MQIAALVFDSITPLDIVGPIEVLARLPGVDIVIVGKERGRCGTRARTGRLPPRRASPRCPGGMSWSFPAMPG